MLQGLSPHIRCRYRGKIALLDRDEKANMASVDGRKGFKQENPALLYDICKDDGQEKNSEVFCCNCEKRLCTSCKTLHKKFCPTHKTVTSTERLEYRKLGDLRLCEQHGKERVQFYCETHAEVLCRLCRSLKHSNCAIQNIKGASS